MPTLDFFTPVNYRNGNAEPSRSSIALNRVDNYFYLGGKKAYVIEGRTKSGQEKTVLLEAKSSLFARIGKVLSYFTVVVPIAMLIAKAILRSKHSFKVIDPQKQLEKGMDISEATTAKIHQLIPKIIKKEDHEDIEWLGKGNNLVFKVKGTPYVYKMDDCAHNTDPFFAIKKRDDRFACMTKAQEVCLTHRLGLLVIPQAIKFDVKVDGKTYALIAEESLDVNPNESANEELYRRFSTELNETVRQLATFVANTGFCDVTWRNIPVLNEAPDFQGPRRIALIDLEHMNRKFAEQGFYGSSNGSCGLIGCASSKEQIDDIIAVAREQGISERLLEDAAKKRLKNLENDEKLRDFYSRKGITTGNEPIQVEDWNSLGLNLSEEHEVSLPEFTSEDQYKFIRRNVTLKKVAEDVIAKMNKCIQKNSAQASLKGKRRFLLNTNGYPMRKYNELPSGAWDAPQEEMWLYRIIQALIKTNHIFALEKINGYGYFIQA